MADAEIDDAKRDGDCFTPSSAPLPSRDYVLLISGTMNPPHIGHVRLGIKAAEKLCAEGHRVSAICYVPVHDNYLFNKVAFKQQSGEKTSLTDMIAFPMVERCALLKSLIEREPSGLHTNVCHVLDYEHTERVREVLAESPGYWAPKLPSGYLKTVPTTALITHFSEHSPMLVGGTKRLAIVFGIDNLAGMSSWNNPEALLSRADLVLLARGLSSVEFGRDPSGLLSAVRHLEVKSAMPVIFGGRELFGGQVGSFVNATAAASEAALILLPPLDGQDEGLSSTAIRSALSARLDEDLTSKGSEAASGDALAETLGAHGYPASMSERIVETASRGAAAVAAMGEEGKRRDEWVVPSVPVKRFKAS